LQRPKDSMVIAGTYAWRQASVSFRLQWLEDSMVITGGV